MAEPEAEADPALLYTGYYPYHYGYYGYPLVKANTGELPYTFGWTDGPNNGLGVAGRKRREADEDVVRKLELSSFTIFKCRPLGRGISRNHFLLSSIFQVFYLQGRANGL